MLHDEVEAATLAVQQLRYTTCHGMLLRDAGRTCPISLDECERRFGTALFEEVMTNIGQWVDVPAELPEPKRIATTVCKLDPAAWEQPAA